jgi:hypothetical protein
MGMLQVEPRPLNAPGQLVIECACGAEITKRVTYVGIAPVDPFIEEAEKAGWARTSGYNWRCPSCWEILTVGAIEGNG